MYMRDLRLTYIQGFEGRPVRTRTHLDGLVELIKAAGGLESMEFTPATRRHVYLWVCRSARSVNTKVFRTCLAAAITMNSKILLDSNLSADLASYFGISNSTTTCLIKTFEARLFNFTGSPLSTCAAHVLWGLRNLTILVDAYHAGTEIPDTPNPFDTQFTDCVEVLERLVHRLWYSEDPKNEQHAIFRTFGWTCCIYIYCTLRELPPELGMNAMLASRIRACLESTNDLNVLLATFQDLCLWVLFMCGRVADPRDRPFFAHQATKILVIRKIERRNEILSAADGFLWPERGVESPVTPGQVSDMSDVSMSDDG